MKDPAARVAPPVADRPEPATKPDPADPARMTVAGRVLGPRRQAGQGRGRGPPGARRAPLGRRQRGDRPSSPCSARASPTPTAGSTSTPRGRRRAASSRSSRSPPRPATASAWAELNPDAEQPEADLKLHPSRSVRVRLIELTGRRRRGSRSTSGASGRPDPTRARPTASRSGTARRRGPPHLAPAGQDRRPGTDHADRASAAGSASPGQVRDLRYARQDMMFDAGRMAARQGDHPRACSRPGSSRAACWPPTPASPSPMPSSRPRPSSRTSTPAASSRQVPRRRPGPVRHEPDRRRQLYPRRLPHRRRAVPDPAGRDQVDQGGVKATHDIKMPRGVLIRGKVTEQGTGRPLAGPRASSTSRSTGTERVLSGWQAIVASRGRRLVPASRCRPARGTCSSSGRPATMSWTRSARTGSTTRDPAADATMAHAIIPYEVKAGDPPREVAAALRPGVTIKGRVEGPDGQTIARRLDPLDAPDRGPATPTWRRRLPGPRPRRPLRAARPRPRGARHVSHILDAEHELGRDGRGLRQAGRRGGDRPPAALR